MKNNKIMMVIALGLFGLGFIFTNKMIYVNAINDDVQISKESKSKSKKYVILKSKLSTSERDFDNKVKPISLSNEDNVEAEKFMPNLLDNVEAEKFMNTANTKDNKEDSDFFDSIFKLKTKEEAELEKQEALKLKLLEEEAQKKAEEERIAKEKKLQAEKYAEEMKIAEEKRIADEEAKKAELLAPTEQILTLSYSSQEFLAEIIPAAIEVSNNYGLYSSVMIAQALHESQYGESGLSFYHKNLFGIKGGAGYNSVYLETNEFFNGTMNVVVEPFRVYNSYLESIEDYAILLTSMPGYYGALKSNSPDYVSAAHGVANGGYASDPNYANSIIDTINRLGLSKYDN